jgi:hypothetical protein
MAGTFTAKSYFDPLQEWNLLRLHGEYFILKRCNAAHGSVLKTQGTTLQREDCLAGFPDNAQTASVAISGFGIDCRLKESHLFTKTKISFEGPT